MFYVSRACALFLYSLSLESSPVVVYLRARCVFCALSGFLKFVGSFCPLDSFARVPVCVFFFVRACVLQDLRVLYEVYNVPSS